MSTTIAFTAARGRNLSITSECRASKPPCVSMLWPSPEHLAGANCMLTHGGFGEGLVAVRESYGRITVVALRG